MVSKKRFMIAIIDYGMGNLFSIYNGLKKVYDYPMLITADNITSMRTAEGVIVPGVGAFDDCIRNLKPFSEELIGVVKSGVPVLWICIGMQILFEESEEGKEKGLGLIPGKVARLPANVRVPHMGLEQFASAKGFRTAGRDHRCGLFLSRAFLLLHAER